MEAASALLGPGRELDLIHITMEDEEIQALQEYANTVSIKRLHYNDHGPVHMRTVALNAIIMMGLLKKSGIKTSIETEEAGSFEDSLAALVTAALLHDIGMSISRQDHELHSEYMAIPILDRLFTRVWPGDVARRTILRSLALECICGHMGNRTIHSLEAGVLLVADGCDMTKGRARIPMAISVGAARVGDIHKYSANAIEEVRIAGGLTKPIGIEVRMSSEVGIFQVEEILLGKISASPAKGYIELFAMVGNGEPKQYL
jgi:metal-dependent HD superfamily phosphatase/phosphodiesterase